jgi:hypothetical protein
MKAHMAHLRKRRTPSSHPKIHPAMRHPSLAGQDGWSVVEEESPQEVRLQPGLPLKRPKSWISELSCIKTDQDKSNCVGVELVGFSPY